MRSDNGGARGRRFFSQGEAERIKKPLRAQYVELISKAAAAGIDNPEGLFDLTPRDITWRLDALAARRRARDELAWMISQYAALAVHTPEKLPPRPTFYGVAPNDMSDEEMKSRLLKWAEKETT